MIMLKDAINLLPQHTITELHCSQGDTALRKWRLPIYHGDVRWAIDADSVVLECSNGAEVTGEILGDFAVFDCTEDLSARAGAYSCRLRFTKGTDVLHTSHFALIVEGSPYDD